jgi:NAD+ diphosphatase
MSTVDESGARRRLNNLVLAKSTVDRSSHFRSDEEKLVELWNESKILVLVDGQFVSSDTELMLFSAREIAERIAKSNSGVGERYFLGVDHATETSYFVWNSNEFEAEEEELKTLRQIGANLTDLEGGLAVHALGLSNWHATHPRCSRCGAPTIVDLGGAMRVCEVDQSQHHPRTDPAIIVLVKDEDDRLLLGRQSIWPEKRFSNFAGFVEPGESFEQCVVREVAEECGVAVHTVHYLASQPWPFPASIMIAFEAVTSDPSTAKADGEEITEICWYSRSEMRKAIQDGELLLPPSISVSRRMIEYWYGPNADTELSQVNG